MAWNDVDCRLTRIDSVSCKVNNIWGRVVPQQITTVNTWSECVCSGMNQSILAESWMRSTRWYLLDDPRFWVLIRRSTLSSSLKDYATLDWTKLDGSSRDFFLCWIRRTKSFLVTWHDYWEQTVRRAPFPFLSTKFSSDGLPRSWIWHSFRCWALAMTWTSAGT